MRLLFDHNLSSRLVSRLTDRYPNASHVALVGLERAADLAVWTYAETNDSSSSRKILTSMM
jgi:predicted nuclease of predicted toxin-antitoxin system